MSAEQVDGQPDVLIPLISSWNGSQKVECDHLAWARREGQRYLRPSYRIFRLFASLAGVASPDPLFDTQSHSDPVLAPLQHSESYFLAEVHCLLVCLVHYPRSEHQGEVYSHRLISKQTFVSSNLPVRTKDGFMRWAANQQLAVVMVG